MSINSDYYQKNFNNIVNEKIILNQYPDIENELLSSNAIYKQLKDEYNKSQSHSEIKEKHKSIK